MHVKETCSSASDGRVVRTFRSASRISLDPWGPVGAALKRRICRACGSRILKGDANAGLRARVKTVPSLKGLGCIIHFTQHSASGSSTPIRAKAARLGDPGCVLG